MDDMLESLNAAYLLRGRKVMTCGSEVMEALRKASTDKPHQPWEPTDLFAVEVVLAEDCPPSSWRIVRHLDCRVDTETGTVSHEDCEILSEGSL